LLFGLDHRSKSYGTNGLMVKKYFISATSTVEDEGMQTFRF
jgi:hypothetical protein